MKIEKVRDEIKAIAGDIEILNEHNLEEDEDYCDLINYAGLTAEEKQELIKHNVILYTSPHFNFYGEYGINMDDDLNKFLENIKIGMEAWKDDELNKFLELEITDKEKFEILETVEGHESEKREYWLDDEFDTISWNEVYIVKFPDLELTFLQHLGGWRGGIMEIEDEKDADLIIKTLKKGENIQDLKDKLEEL